VDATGPIPRLLFLLDGTELTSNPDYLRHPDRPEGEQPGIRSKSDADKFTRC
jgi:hypothetical protein